MKMGDSKKDYKASLIIGVVAGILSVPVVNNFGVTNPVMYAIIALALFAMPPIGMAIARFIGKKSLSLYQFIKFAETGGLNTFVDLGVLNLLILISGISAGLYYSVFKGISFVAAILNSYFWNKHWVFESKAKGESGEKEFAKFIAVSGGGFLVNVGVASLIVFLTKDSTAIDPKIMANIAAAIAFIMTMMWNFLGYKLVVFVKPKKK
ncbi:GtrA family protein [candidate division WS5 bacterium]|uniref:GtrA family protein n=1 Tax=candidate division WS5 bacterium TaxID=2093353 RepID=A0A419DEC8_9BACT|nr:MAG: GtrA family protein [candidate division WS5 bacterium]